MLKNDLFQDLHERGFLAPLLPDRTSKKNIFWATATYTVLGFGRLDHLNSETLLGLEDSLQALRKEKRLERIRKHGEVFTPLWVCEKMCAFAHETLATNNWQKYINSTVLEICCGEAPFLVSRRDLSTASIIPMPNRIGLLDKKIQLINNNIDSQTLWLDWVFKAFQATYGYEFQGDNLLMARINLLKSFEEYFQDRWASQPPESAYQRILEIISWNIWQMDGLTGMLPFGMVKQSMQYSLFGDTPKNQSPKCLIKDWKTGDIIPFADIAKK